MIHQPFCAHDRIEGFNGVRVCVDCGEEVSSGMSRRGFLGRLFVIGAGIAASGTIVRAIESLAPAVETDAFVAVGSFSSQLIVTRADWDALLMEDYVVSEMIKSINVATPFRRQLSSRQLRRLIPVEGEYGGEERYFDVRVANGGLISRV